MSEVDLTRNWGQKHYHNLKWGIHTNITQDYSVNDTVYQRLENQDLNKIPNDNKHLLIFGNIWANKHEPPRFHNPAVIRLVHRHRYVFWDNPALPHLLYKGPWNPDGYKNWCRMCWDWINPTPHTKPANVSGSERINEHLKRASGGAIRDWRELSDGLRDCRGGRRALLVPSSPEWHHYYLNQSVEQWIKTRTQVLESRGYTVVVRPKPSRQAREGAAGKLYQQLEGIGLVVSEGVSALEAIMAGVPALVGDWAPTGPLATRWDDFLMDEPIDTPTADRTDEWMERVLQDTFHKSEIYSGEWHVE